MGLIKMRILEDDNLIGQLDKLDDILNKRVEKYKKYNIKNEFSKTGRQISGKDGR